MSPILDQEEKQHYIEELDNYMSRLYANEVFKNI